MALRTLILREEKELPTEIDATSKAEKGRELAKALVELQNLAQEQDTARADFKARTKEIEARVLQLRDVVLEGRELRTVTVEHWGDHETRRVRVTRTDTGHLINERPMTAEEAQLPIEFVGPDESKPAPEKGEGDAEA